MIYQSLAQKSIELNNIQLIKIIFQKTIEKKQNNKTIENQLDLSGK